MATKQRLELTWIGKYEQSNLEPRILIEDSSKSYGDKRSENMLIHGDNLLALKALEQDFTEKIKCIYIDPPYNTGTAFTQYEDGLEHSIWLNLIKPRMELLHKLLTKNGMLWVSIDDNECHYLKVLLDEIFGRNNFIACLPTVMNLKGNQDQFGFAGTHEYTLVYAKNKQSCLIYEFNLTEDDLEVWDSDDIGLYKQGAPLRATGEESTREHRPYMFYPILIKDGVASTISDDEHKLLFDKNTKLFSDLNLKQVVNKYESLGYEVVLPKVNQDTYGRWRWGFNEENKQRLEYDVVINKTKDGVSLYKKQRPEIGELPSKKPKTLFYKPEYSSGNGTSQIKKLFGRSSFMYPKPEELIRDIIQLSTREGDYVLDSFLGSGTTAAVAHKMNRKYIGIELGPQCDSLCLSRLKLVTEGKDHVGISSSMNWKGGSGFKFYELAPSLLKKDDFGNWVIEEQYKPDMLAAAMAKHEGFKYCPDQQTYWKHGQSTERDFIYTTTNFLTVEMLDKIHDEMKHSESLLICCKSFSKPCDGKYSNITVKKIPNMLLGRCEFGKKDYSLNIVSMPIDDDEPEFVPAGPDVSKEKPKGKKVNPQPDLFSAKKRK